MAKIITENFRVEVANELFKSFFNRNEEVATNFETAFNIYNVNNSAGLSDQIISDASNIALAELDQLRPENHYYIFGSSVDRDNDIDNTQAEKREFQRRVIFGNKIGERDIKYIFDLNNWVSGTIYDQFDDETDLTNSNFYATVLDGSYGEGAYKVFKCLRNNSRGPSTSRPATDSELVDANYELQLPDGYVWKYMFEVPATEYTIYATTTGLPYVENVGVKNSAVENISNIEIEQTQSALFSDYTLGNAYMNSVIEDDTSINQYRIEVVTTIAPRSVEDAYKNMILRFTNTGDIYTIVGSAIPDLPDLDVTENRRLYLYVQSESTLINEYDQGATVAVSPKINISKSGGTQATAYGVLNTQGTLTSVEFINKGTDYKFAAAALVLPPTLETQRQQAGEEYVNTILRVIPSPRGGHGSDPINELFMSKLAVITNFYSDSGRNTPHYNFYTKVGIVKNPVFSDGLFHNTIDNRMIMTATGNVTSTLVAVDSIVSQVVDSETITGRIHEISYDIDTNTSTIYLVDYAGAFAGTFTTGEVTVKTSATAEDSSVITINNVTPGNYVTYSGDLLHFIDFEQVERSPDRKEKIKFVFDF